MESASDCSGKKLSISDTENPNQRTLDEVLEEIREIIDNTHWVQTRLAKLESCDYQIEECWVKNGSIGIIWFMKRKKVFRIQVTDSELHGNYHKANCVVIPEKEVDLRNYNIATIRNIQKK